jgi:hypothetical protein
MLNKLLTSKNDCANFNCSCELVDFYNHFDFSDFQTFNVQNVRNLALCSFRKRWSIYHFDFRLTVRHFDFLSYSIGVFLWFVLYSMT